MFLGKRVKAIRMGEGLSQDGFSQLIDISKGTLQNYEQGKNLLSEESLMKITNHPQFQKYTLWLMTGQTAPESGQVCPEFSIQEKCGLIVDVVEKRA